MTTPTPYVPAVPLQGGIQALLSSVVQVIRLNAILTDSGDVSMSWAPITAVVDPVLNMPGLLQCRLDLGFIRRGIDQPAAIIAGKAPDRVGVCYFMPATDPVTGIPLVLAGDRLLCVANPLTGRLPVTGTFEIRPVPDMAQDFIGGHHVEVQVVEVSQALQPGAITPFPGATT